MLVNDDLKLMVQRIAKKYMNVPLPKTEEEMIKGIYNGFKKFVENLEKGNSHKFELKAVYVDKEDKL